MNISSVKTWRIVSFFGTYTKLTIYSFSNVELVKKQLKKHRSGEEHDKLQQLLQRMVRGSATCGHDSKWEVILWPYTSLLATLLIPPLRSSKNWHSRNASGNRSCACN